MPTSMIKKSSRKWTLLLVVLQKRRWRKETAENGAVANVVPWRLAGVVSRTSCRANMRTTTTIWMV
jgi:hypothetical protein